MNEEINENQSIPTSASPGQLLREAREAKKLGVAEVAEKLNLLKSVVQALEADSYDKLRGDTFTRGYLKNYARLVDVEESELIHAYAFMTNIPTAEQPKSFFGRRRHAVDAAAQGAGRIGIVLVLMAVTAFLLFQNRKPIADPLTPAITEHSVEIDTRNGTRIVPLTPSPSIK